MSSSSSSRRHRRGRGPLAVVGLLVLLVGVAALGWVGYQTVGTGLVAQHAFRAEKDNLRGQWQQQSSPTPSPRTTARATPRTKGDPTESTAGSASADPSDTTVLDASPGPGEPIALLRIPRFGDGYEIPILDGTDLRTLSRGVGRYRDTALPGQVGNFALAGHRVTHGQPFAKLLDLDRGDEVVVETRTAVYTYVIDEPPRSLTVRSSASWVLDPVPGQPAASPTEALITLTTCQDLFHSPDRSIGFGHLASTRNKG